MNKHSSGPWTMDDRKVLLSAEGEELALLGWGTPADERLIVAAPEMLALLREIEADFTVSDWRVEIRALIARIDGGK